MGTYVIHEAVERIRKIQAQRAARAGDVMNNQSLVYVAGPMSQGDQVLNVRAGILAGLQIAQAGHVPFVPHLFHFAQYLVPMPYEFWLSMDLKMLKRCDCLVRLAGDSAGADREVDLAKTIGMPVYFSVEECLQDLPDMRNEVGR